MACYVMLNITSNQRVCTKKREIYIMYIACYKGWGNKHASLNVSLLLRKNYDPSLIINK